MSEQSTQFTITVNSGGRTTVYKGSSFAQSPLALLDAEIRSLKAAGDKMEAILQVVEALEDEEHILSDIDAALRGWLDARDDAT